jgi:hypothetical protein
MADVLETLLVLAVPLGVLVIMFVVPMVIDHREEMARIQAAANRKAAK